MKHFDKQFWHSALARAIRTVCQTALSLLTVSGATSYVNWLDILGSSLIAGLYSVLTSIVTGLPEAGQDKENNFWSSAFIRAARTVCQTALSMLTVNSVGSGYVNWGAVLGSATLAGLYSLLTSVVTGLPEAQDYE